MRKLSRKALSIVMSVVLVVGLCPGLAYADEASLQIGTASLEAQDDGNEPVTASGTWGQLSWRLDANGCLTITGTGPMDDFESTDGAWFAYADSITSAVVAPGVTAIGDYAFSGCGSLKAIELPEGITRIGYWAFGVCGLDTVALPASLDDLSDNCGLAECADLKSITVADGCQRFHADASGALYEESELVAYPSGSTAARFEVEAGTTVVRSGAVKAERVEAISLPASLADWRATDGRLPSLKRFEVPDGNPVYLADEKGVLYRRGAADGDGSDQSAGSGLELVSYPMGLQDESYSVLDGTVKIGARAFAEASLKSLDLGSSMASIDEFGFKGSSLRSIAIPASCTEISPYGVHDCPDLERIEVGDGNPRYFADAHGALYDSAFSDQDAVATLVKYPAASSDSSYAVLPGTGAIGPGCFEYAANLQRVVLPSSVESVYYGAFDFSGVAAVTSLSRSIEVDFDRIWAYSDDYAPVFRCPEDSTLKSWAETNGYTCNPIATPDFEIGGLAERYDYTGDAIRPGDSAGNASFQVTFNGSPLSADDYDVYYCDNVAGPVATVLVAGTGEYAGYASEATFEIEGAPVPQDAHDLSLGSISEIDDVALAWLDGSVDGWQGLRFSVCDLEGAKLDERNYTVSFRLANGSEIYEDIPAALGDYKLVVTGVDPYYGELTADFKVVDRIPLVGSEPGRRRIYVTLDGTTLREGTGWDQGDCFVMEDGSDHYSSVAVDAHGSESLESTQSVKLNEGVDYEVKLLTGDETADPHDASSWSEVHEAVDAGFYIVRVSGLGNYIGDVDYGFWVLDAYDFRAAQVEIPKLVASEEPYAPMIKVSIGDTLLRPDVDYVVGYYHVPFSIIAGWGTTYRFIDGVLQAEITKIANNNGPEAEVVEDPEPQSTVSNAGKYLYVVQGIGDYALKEADAGALYVYPFVHSSSFSVVEPGSSEPDDPNEPGRADDAVPVYKVYDPETANRLYTADASWVDELVGDEGWTNEGVAFYGYAEPGDARTPVYCIHNESQFTHNYVYTTNAEQRDALVRMGFADKGVAWYLDDGDTVTVYQAYNPYSGEDYYTTSESEADGLRSIGWSVGTSSWKAAAAGTSAEGPLDHVAIRRAWLAKTSYAYTGSAIVPDHVYVNGDGDEAIPEDRYDITYSENVNVGTVTITVTGKDGYTGSATTTFEIVATSDTVVLEGGSGNVTQVTGETTSFADERPEGENSAVELIVSEKNDEAAERLKAEYAGDGGDAVFASVIDVRLVAVTKDGEGNETARREIGNPERLTLTFDVAAGDIDLEGKLATVVHVHGGTEAGRSVQPVRDGKVTITVDSLSDFVIVVQDDDFAYDLASDGVSVTLPEASFKYDGAEHEPVPTVVANGQRLVAGRDFSVAYAANKDAGEGAASVTVRGIEPYTGEATLRFSIAKRKVELESASASKVYDGAALASAGAKAGGDGFVAGEASNLRAVGSITDAGSASNAISFDRGAAFKDANYEIVRSEGTLTVVPAAITSAAAAPGSVAPGPAKRPALSVKAGALDVPESGYTAAWPADEGSAGAKTVTVTGRGNYTGSARATYLVEAPSDVDAGKGAGEPEDPAAAGGKPDSGGKAADGAAGREPSGNGASGQNAGSGEAGGGSSGGGAGADGGPSGGAGTGDGSSGGVVSGVQDAVKAAGVSMHRLYNEWSGEHFYTADDAEFEGLVALGWTDEGEGWKAPTSSGTPVYRLYNPYAGEHHYTMDAAERDSMVDAGWTYEDVGWYSDDAQTVPLYREYNPFEFSNNHNYTTDAAEHEFLVSIGWVDEGYAWYGV